MKNIIRIILLSGILGILLSACNDDDSKDIFPDKYVKILSLKESGIINLEMNTTQQSVVDSILILKGGGRPNSVSNIELKILTKEEAAAYGGYETDQLQIIPSDAYDMVTGENIKLEANESSKYIPVTFYPQKIYAAMKEYGDDVVWALPVALVSSTDTINFSQNRLFMRFEVNSPLVDWDIENMQSAEITYLSLDWSISVRIANSESNTLDFTCELDASENEQLVNAYNSQNGTEYVLLPAGSYDFDKFTFNVGEKMATSKLTLARTGLQSDQEYLLPLKLGKISTSAIDKTEDIRFLVVTNPKYGYKEMDKTNWKIVFANNQQPWNAPAYYATSLIDGSLETAWSTNWGAEIPTWDDYDYGSVDYWGYHCFWARRDIPNIVIVVDLERKTYLGGVGIGQGTLDMGDRDLKSCEVYVSDSFTFTADSDLDNYNTVNKGNDWALALTCTNIPNAGGGPYWYNVSDADIAAGVSKGRYLKIRPTESHREDKLVSFSELYVKEIVTVDGIAVE